MRTKNGSTRGATAPSKAETKRLALSRAGSAHGCVDGAWWPTSADLGSELPDLVAVFSRWIGSIHRIVYDPVLWTTAPSRLIKHGSAISVDPYRMVNRETIALMGTHSRSAVLFVVSPAAPAVIAHKMLDLVERSAEPVAAALLLQHYAELSAKEMAVKAASGAETGSIER